MIAGPYRRGRDRSLIPTASTPRTGGYPRDGGVVETAQIQASTTFAIVEAIVAMSAPTISDCPGTITSRRAVESAPDPIASRVESVPRRNSERPSDSLPATPTSLGILRASGHRKYANGASKT